MHTLYRSEEIAQMDARALEQGATLESLTSAVGRQMARCICQAHPHGRVWIFCGPGLNGTDGVALAAELAATHQVRLFCLGKGQERAERQFHLRRLKETRVEVYTIENFAHWGQGLTDSTPNLVVDALFGTGSNRAPEGMFAAAIETINTLGKEADVWAVDLPSGVFPDAGGVHQAVVQAHHTVTFMGYKPAHLLFPAAEKAGRVQVVYPFESDYRAQIPRGWFTQSDVRPITRARASHKGTYGCVVAVVGSRTMVGAGEMCVKSALRAGCGTLVLASPCTVSPFYRNKLTCAMTQDMPDTDGQYDRGGAPILASLLAHANAAVLGPGMGQGAGIAELLQAALVASVPLVLDADALNTLARLERTDWLRHAAGPVVLTPHPMELARLMRVEVSDLLGDPFSYSERFARETGCIVVLKNASTIVAAPDRSAVITTGGPGMAKGGSGDVLAGCITGLLAQGYAPFYAACLGVYVCGRAGEKAQQRLGMTAMLPTDTIAALPEVFRSLEQKQGDALFE